MEEDHGGGAAAQQAPHSWDRRAGQKVVGQAAGQKTCGGSCGRTGWSPKRKNSNGCFQGAFRYELEVGGGRGVASSVTEEGGGAEVL